MNQYFSKEHAAVSFLSGRSCFVYAYSVKQIMPQLGVRINLMFVQGVLHINVWNAQRDLTARFCENAGRKIEAVSA